MAITDLTGTTWYVPSGWSAKSGYGSFYVDYTIAGNEHSFYTFGVGQEFYSTNYGSLIGAQDKITFRTRGSTYAESITNDKGFTITITGDMDVTNASLIAWLEANGELQEQETTDLQPVYKRVNGEWVKQNAYKRVNGEWVQISKAESGLQLDAPVISLQVNVLTITDESGLATSFDILIDGEVKYTLSKFLYNGVLLPTIPILADYPYRWIRNNTTSGYYDLLLCQTQRYYNNGIFPDDTCKWYRIRIANENSAGWTYYKDNTNYYGIDSARPVMWSNHDIPNGSATATDIYFEGTEPVPSDVGLTSVTFNLKNLGLEYETDSSITCIAKANGYNNSVESNKVEYTLPDLTGTTWYVPSGWSATAGYGEFDIQGRFNESDTGYWETAVFYIGYFSNINSHIIASDNNVCSVSSNKYHKAVSSTEAFTLKITGGTDVTNADLIAWLEIYGELQ